MNIWNRIFGKRSVLRAPSIVKRGDGHINFVEVLIKDRPYLVSNDYYKENGIRMPVDMRRAHEIADYYGAKMPTVEQVNEIWKNGVIHLAPKPLAPSSEMTKMSYFVTHNNIINDQLKKFKMYDLNEVLIVGHKKDIMFIPRTSDKVAIYGWHKLDGTPIQPYSTVHSWNYKDYSHGLRLIKDIK